jgi:hypothetical protein
MTMFVGPILVLAIGCFFAWGGVSMIRNGYYIGRNHHMRSGSKRYYLAAHPITFWFLAGSALLLAFALISMSVLHLTGVHVLNH